MSIDVVFVEPQRILLQTWREPVDAEQMEQLRELMHEHLLPAAGGKLHIIADMRQVERLPSILLRNGLRMLNNAHPNTGMIVFVTEDAGITTLANLFMRLMPKCSLRIVTAYDEALAIVSRLPH